MAKEKINELQNIANMKIDILNRNEFVKQFITIFDGLEGSDRNWTIAINGKWGSGKSFVLEIIEKELQTENLVLHYNAWENDFYAEPLIAMLSSFADEINKLLKTENIIKGITKEILNAVAKTFCNIAGNLTKYLTGINIVKLVQDAAGKVKKVKNENEISKNFDENAILRKAIIELREGFLSISSKIKLVVVVDELDRCLPEYAIKVLERLHHVFDGLQNSVTILAVDKEQLNNTVEKIYGTKENEKIANFYLNKFINFEIKLPDTNVNDKFKEKFDKYIKLFNNSIPIDKIFLDSFISNILDKIEIREQVRLIERAELIHKIFVKENCDFSVLLFEIMWIILVQKYQLKKSHILKNKISKDNVFGYSDLKNMPCCVYLSELFKQLNITNKDIDSSHNFINFDTNKIYPCLLFGYLTSLSNHPYEFSATEEILNLVDKNIKFIKEFNKGIDLIY